MKSLPLAFQSHLDSGATTLAWCWRLTRGDGLVQGFTDHDRDLAFDGTTFAAATGFKLSRTWLDSQERFSSNLLLAN